LKIQHALRAFTAKDRKAIKLTAENYPISDHYNTAEVLTSLGIGEALVSVLNEKGIPTPLAQTMLRAPMSRMDVLTKNELKEVIDNSDLTEKYNENIDRESAYELLNEKIEKAEAEEAKEAAKKEREKLDKKSSATSTRKRSSKSSNTTQKAIIKVLTSATFIRGALGVLNKMLR